MTPWRPPRHIRAKVIGLAWRGAHLLAVEVRDDAGRLKGVRPPGGSIAFGETREEALIREFREELGCGVTRTGPWSVFENIFRHEGALGHEIVFAADLDLHDAALYGRDAIRFREDDGTPCTARWFRPTPCRRAPRSFPMGSRPHSGRGRETTAVRQHQSRRPGRLWVRKKSSIAREASGPFGSV